MLYRTTNIFLPLGYTTRTGYCRWLRVRACVRAGVRTCVHSSGQLSQELLIQSTIYLAHIIVTIGRCARSTFIDPTFKPTSPGRPSWIHGRLYIIGQNNETVFARSLDYWLLAINVLYVEPYERNISLIGLLVARLNHMKGISTGCSR